MQMAYPRFFTHFQAKAFFLSVADELQKLLASEITKWGAVIERVKIPRQ